MFQGVFSSPPRFQKLNLVVIIACSLCSLVVKVKLFSECISCGQSFLQTVFHLPEWHGSNQPGTCSPPLLRQCQGRWQGCRWLPLQHQVSNVHQQCRLCWQPCQLIGRKTDNCKLMPSINYNLLTVGKLKSFYWLGATIDDWQCCRSQLQLLRWRGSWQQRGELSEGDGIWRPGKPVWISTWFQTLTSGAFCHCPWLAIFISSCDTLVEQSIYLNCSMKSKTMFSQKTFLCYCRYLLALV